MYYLRTVTDTKTTAVGKNALMFMTSIADGNSVTTPSNGTEITLQRSLIGLLDYSLTTKTMRTLDEIPLRLTELPREKVRKMGKALIYYPAQWGGNAHPKNRLWCAVYPDPKDECDYGSLRYLIRSLQSEGVGFMIVRRKRLLTQKQP